MRASLAALTFSTPDPLGNYREALASRGGAEVVSLGWSPFDVFRVFRKAGPALPVVAMLSAPVAATASVANLFRGSGKKAKPAPAPAPAPVPPPAAPAETPASSKKDPEEAVAGEEKPVSVNLTYAEIQHILSLKKDFLKKFNESMATQKPFKNPLTNSDMAWLYKMAAKEKRSSVDDYFVLADKYAEPFLQIIDQSLQTLRANKIPIIGETTSSGEDKTFRDLVRAALKSKKMSRDDFNRAVAAHVDAGASKEVQAAAGEQVLKFMEKHGVKVG